MSKTIEIDGGYLEGGGQILRNALSLSCILNIPVKIKNIRANRPKPGLSHQHVHAINLLQKITNANVNGNILGSCVIDFSPKEIKSGSYVVDTKTAGSVTLIFQAALPVLLFGEKTSILEIIGGTNVSMAPQVEEITEVLRPNLESMGISFDFDLHRRGYYPKGGGKCIFTIPAVKYIQTINRTNYGNLIGVTGWAYVAGRLPKHLADDMKKFAEKELQHLSNVNIESYKESTELSSVNGSGIVLTATTTGGCTLGSSCLGEKIVNAQDLGESSARKLCQILNDQVCIDEHVQDQLILYMALATGASRFTTSKITDHTKTAIHIAELMTNAKFHIKDISSARIMISCNGIGKVNTNI